MLQEVGVLSPCGWLEDNEADCNRQRAACLKSRYVVEQALHGTKCENEICGRMEGEVTRCKTTSGDPGGLIH